MTVAHASLLRFLECMNSNVDQFLTRRYFLSSSNIFHFFELYELYFISVKVLKVQIKNKVHKVRTSQLCSTETSSIF